MQELWKILSASSGVPKGCFVSVGHQECYQFFVKPTETFLQLEFGLTTTFEVKFVTTDNDKQQQLRRISSFHMI